MSRSVLFLPSSLSQQRYSNPSCRMRETHCAQYAFTTLLYGATTFPAGYFSHPLPPPNRLQIAIVFLKHTENICSPVCRVLVILLVFYHRRARSRLGGRQRLAVQWKALLAFQAWATVARQARSPRKCVGVFMSLAGSMFNPELVLCQPL